MTRTSTTTTLRLSVDERAALDRAAESAGLGPSAFARLAVVRAAGARPSPVRKRRSDVARQIAGVLGELGRIGSNINQLSRHANRTGDVGDLAQIRAELERATRAVLALREPTP